MSFHCLIKRSIGINSIRNPYSNCLTLLLGQNSIPFSLNIIERSSVWFTSSQQSAFLKGNSEWNIGEKKGRPQVFIHVLRTSMPEGPYKFALKFITNCVPYVMKNRSVILHKESMNLPIRSPAQYCLNLGDKPIQKTANWRMSWRKLKF